MYVSVNGKITFQNRASVQAVTDGLFYGAGCFETLKSYQGLFLHFQQHVDRLNAGLRYLTESGKNAVASETLLREINELLKVNKLAESEAKVRIQFSIQDRLGYCEAKSSQLFRVITADKIEDTVKNRTLRTSKINVIPSSCKPAQYKLSNMLNYRKAGIEAKKTGADDALMMTVDDFVAETSIANLFWETDGRFYTPSILCDILPGVTRSIVLDLLENMGYSVVKGEFSRSDLMSSRQVWCTNSVMEIAQISTINNVDFETDTELFSRVKQEFQKYKNDHLK